MKKQILEILVLSGELSESMEKVILNYISEWGCSAFHALLETMIFTDSELADFLAKFFKMDRIYNASITFADEDVMRVIPFKDALSFECMPLRFVGGEKSMIEVLIADPTRSDVINKIKKSTKCDLVFAIGERQDILDSIKSQYPVELQLPTLGFEEGNLSE